ncbi:hypothetical protein B0A49_10268 [Cryomyces minteri]|uniref:Uncharacterized protein n=1 Tax=Cryomyces minteri TaxID=331657 RepID=A0A4U0WTZ7_9PEZI|nr:hypothetical protein B0A49_10268 [Cryomyces minteri]
MVTLQDFVHSAMEAAAFALGAVKYSFDLVYHARSSIKQAVVKSDTAHDSVKVVLTWFIAIYRALDCLQKRLVLGATTLLVKTIDNPRAALWTLSTLLTLLSIKLILSSLHLLAALFGFSPARDTVYGGKSDSKISRSDFPADLPFNKRSNDDIQDGPKKRGRQSKTKNRPPGHIRQLRKRPFWTLSNADRAELNRYKSWELTTSQPARKPPGQSQRQRAFDQRAADSLADLPAEAAASRTAWNALPSQLAANDAADKEDAQRKAEKRKEDEANGVHDFLRAMNKSTMKETFKQTATDEENLGAKRKVVGVHKRIHSDAFSSNGTDTKTGDDHDLDLATEVQNSESGHDAQHEGAAGHETMEPATQTDQASLGTKAFVQHDGTTEGATGPAGPAAPSTSPSTPQPAHTTASLLDATHPFLLPTIPTLSPSILDLNALSDSPSTSLPLASAAVTDNDNATRLALAQKHPLPIPAAGVADHNHDAEHETVGTPIERITVEGAKVDRAWVESESESESEEDSEGETQGDGVSLRFPHA